MNVGIETLPARPGGFRPERYIVKLLGPQSQSKRHAHVLQAKQEPQVGPDMADDEIATEGVATTYEDEDTSPTTDKELRGWYFYGIAAEAFAVCGPGSFLPVALEQLARENGVLWSDRSTPCLDASKGDSQRLLAARAEGDSDQCVINVLGADITTASFAMYTFSLAVFVQAVALISFSSVADYG